MTHSGLSARGGEPAAKSPRITHLSWGRLEIQGESKPFKDGKLFPGGAREWDWSETGTHHEPGIQPSDVQELIDHGAEAIVLSKGIYERLKVCPETVSTLRNQNIDLYILQTEEAVQEYNELTETRLVGGLFHSTC